MSFILDALKKSENDRQRQSGPALFEVRVAPPRSRFPAWAIALVALLVVNLGVIGWLMLRRPAVAATPPTQPSASNPPAVQYGPAGTQLPANSPPAYGPNSPPAGYQMGAAPGAPGSGVPPGTYGMPQGNPGYGSQPGMTAGAPYGSQPPPAPYGSQQPAAPYGSQPGAGTTTGAPYGGQAGQYDPARGGGAYASGQTAPGYPGTQPPALTDDLPAEGNPDDYAPAMEPANAASAGSVRRGLASGLMTYEEAATKNTIPPLRMDLHVYAPDPRQRFVLVNMKRLHEGETLPEGVKIENITTDGAVLSYRGLQFVMERD